MCIYIYIIYIIYESNTKPHVSYIILCVCVDPVTLSVMVSRTYSSRASEMSCPNFEVWMSTIKEEAFCDSAKQSSAHDKASSFGCIGPACLCFCVNCLFGPVLSVQSCLSVGSVPVPVSQTYLVRYSSEGINLSVRVCVSGLLGLFVDNISCVWLIIAVTVSTICFPTIYIYIWKW